MKRTTVGTRTKKRIVLTTDDTLTLALPGMIESTPEMLAELICRRSLQRIASHSPDTSERAKAAKALRIQR